MSLVNVNLFGPDSQETSPQIMVIVSNYELIENSELGVFCSVYRINSVSLLW